MIADLGIFRAAKLANRPAQRGRIDPGCHTGGRAAGRGRHRGLRVWWAIVRAIKELQRERGPGEAVN